MTNPEGPSGKARYAQFTKTKEGDKLSGQRFIKGDWRIKLRFGDPQKLLRQIAEENEHFEEDLKDDYPDYEPIAVRYVAPGEDVDGQTRDIFAVVDTSTDDYPVLIWSHDGDFEQVSESFGEFLGDLKTG